jgi:hypothetical protein
MSQSRAEGTAPAPSATSSEGTAQQGKEKPCQDPTEYYPTDYVLKAAVATRRSELYAEDKDKVEERYKKLDGAQQRYEDKWKDQRKPWDNLYCQLKRIREKLYQITDKPTRDHLLECWCEIVKDTDTGTKPPECGEVDKKESCDKLTGKDIAELRRLEKVAADCVTRYDREFDELAELPDKIQEKITKWIEDATKLEDAMAAPGSDPQRRYVEYLDLERRVRKGWETLQYSAAEYGCKLKDTFRALLYTHRTAICVKVLIYEYEKKEEYEKDAKEKKSGKVIDRVLECVLQKPSPTPPKDDKKFDLDDSVCDKPTPTTPTPGYGGQQQGGQQGQGQQPGQQGQQGQYPQGQQGQQQGQGQQQRQGQGYQQGQQGYEHPTGATS